jgi:hypothetical protein
MHHEIARALHQRTVERADELDLVEDGEVLPERIDDKGRLVLLNRQLWVAVGVHPGMPATAERAAWRVLVHQVAAIRHRAGAEVEEGVGEVAIARMAHDICHQRAVARPHIVIAVAREVPHVPVGRGDNRPVVVDLRARDEQATPIEVRQVIWQVAEVHMFAA